MNSIDNSTARTKYIFAAILVFLAAILFSAKAVMVKLAYRYEVDSVSLMTIRMAFALPFFLLTAWYASKKKTQGYKINKRDWFYIALFGIMGYYAASLFDFLGLQYVTASLERIILFIYPTLVLIITAVFLKKKISGIQYFALFLTYIGIGIAFLENLSQSQDEHFLLGSILIFLAAVTYAIYIVGSGNLLPRIGSIRYNSYAMSFASLAIILHHALVYQLDLFHFEMPVYFLGILMAIVSTVIPSFLLTEGIRVIGSSNTAIIGSIGPISTIVLAYIFLDERLGSLQWIGTFLVIGGVLLITFRKS